jgi:diguanylate cyclase (GGDEF)-like protein
MGCDFGQGYIFAKPIAGSRTPWGQSLDSRDSSHGRGPQASSRHFIMTAKPIEPSGSARAPKWIIRGSLILASLMLLLIGAMLVRARNQAWADAEQNAENTKQGLVGEIRSQLDLYATLLDVAAGLLSGPDTARASLDMTSPTLTRMVRSFEVAGIIIVLDREGRSILDSNGTIGQQRDFSDRPYFQVHNGPADPGLYISEPFRSRLRNGDSTIALSRRISDEKRNFAGVVVVALRLEYFGNLFSRIDLGVNGALSLVNTDGTVLMRTPSADGRGDVGRDFSRGAGFARTRSEVSGSYVAVANIDGVERYISFGRVPGFPLVINVSTSTEEILGEWRRQAIVIGLVALTISCALVILALCLRRMIDQLETAKQALLLAASTDQLTSLANRREFDSAMRREWLRAVRDRTPLSVLMIDADHFKRVNDTFGHAEGDEVLKTVAFAIRASLKRPADLAARYGGEEFAVILPNTGPRGALIVAEAARQNALEASEEAKSKGRAGVTVSVGAASIVPNSTESLELLAEAADRALYEAKRSGRNQSRLAGAGEWNHDPTIAPAG